MALENIIRFSDSIERWGDSMSKAWEELDVGDQRKSVLIL